MIRRGRAEGWLKEPIEKLPSWAKFQGARFNGIKFGLIPGFESRGTGIIAEREVTSDAEVPLMVIPKDLIVSKENIYIIAKSDPHLREVLQALGELGRTTRGAVLTFLLMQASICCPDIKDVGTRTPLTEYIKFLPDELLPTFWTEEELDLATGTTLRPAVRAKKSSLLREFENFRTATEDISWCAKYWWNEDDGLLTLDDWMRVDAMYRSRALEFPGVGDAMVPCIDMANHASGDATAALYEVDGDGNAILLLRDGKQIPTNGEITITYGDDKGACETIFSYGFIEDTMASAKVLFLDLPVPRDDPLGPAKQAISNAAPGFLFRDKDGRIEWESDYVWLVLVNEEDGLGLKLKQTIDGSIEIEAAWKENELNDPSKLHGLLQEEPLWDIYQARAVELLLDRTGRQIETLGSVVGEPAPEEAGREGPRGLASRLRSLELDMLRHAWDMLNDQKTALMNSETLHRYLEAMQIEEDIEEEEDFT